MRSRFFDFRCGGLQIEERPSAGWARNIIGLKNARAGCLQNVIRQSERLSGRLLALHQDRVANPVTEQRANIGGGSEKSLEK
jgi:hypothetical protein